jgi:hypothetical protein
MFDAKSIKAAAPAETPDYHRRQAAHLRKLAGTVTTSPLETRLLREAEELEQFAQERNEIA